jgi:hypothetical protein
VVAECAASLISLSAPGRSSKWTGMPGNGCELLVSAEKGDV